MSMKNKFKDLFSVEDEEYYEEVYETEEDASPKERRSEKYDRKDKKEHANVVSLQAVKAQAKVVLCEPKQYEETQEIADHIVNRRSVVVNLQRVNHQEATRIVDFLSGTVYAVAGEIQKLGPHTFLCTPDNVEISGSISSLQDDEDLEQGW
ncbi:cell division inhibitor SepF [Streptohalobacillus salinus]|uniref:Cell division protein SepF n=1 Tax=Streptohalobacillus salinus TaxID=621096 RepID=A0A2V3WGS4_9BACI|nr:cell division protein SepF [Streptohalobacillus salinus]PXW92601.1 cell division inhibitor SepF [Streptohalobacillus salinus]